MSSRQDGEFWGAAQARQGISFVNGALTVSALEPPAGLVELGSAGALVRAVDRFPRRMSEEEFYAAAYPVMFFARRLEARLLELFHKGYVKGTVALGTGNEAVATGMAMPLRPGRDVVGLMHRDLPAHLLLGATPAQLICQYMANQESPTHAREGNVHHGDAAARRFPMISHLGKMLSPVVGATWAARREGEDIFGLAVVGDGGSSTGEFHEAINLAAVQRVPVLFLIENNHYSFSTPTSAQYRCRRLSDRAVGYGIEGRTIDGTDAFAVYQAVCEALEAMAADPRPALLECMTLRLCGHAAYDKADYVPPELFEQWRAQDPLPRARARYAELCGCTEAEVGELEEAVEEEIRQQVSHCLRVPRPDPARHCWSVFAAPSQTEVEPFSAQNVKFGTAVNLALDYLLAQNPSACLLGLDVGVYGSAFKTCKGLIDRHGPDRVIDLPVCESATVGFALGAAQAGALPIVEFQFADFSTEAVTQLGMNTGTWFFRSGTPAQVLFRLPCGGGLTMGAFHSGEYEGLWARFPGLKLLYPATPQEMFEALVAGFYDPNPCLVFEHKLLYWTQRGDIDFDGRLDRVWRTRQYTEGDELTLLAFGAMVHEALHAAKHSPRQVELLNPFALEPLDLEPILRSVEKTGRLLVVQEAGQTRGLGDRLISLCVQQAAAHWQARPALCAAPDVPVPFAPELEAHCRPSAQTILDAIERLFL